MTAIRIRVTGTVQGVGFRPFVYRAAQKAGLTGFVANDAAGVTIEAHGPQHGIDQLLADLDKPPRLSRIESIEVESLDRHPVPNSFEIRSSEEAQGRTTIPADSAICDECLAEMRDPSNRRFEYPLIACTACGPRFTITTGLPYDREHTTMAGFELCPPCQREYTDPTSRRYHAQPTACSDCGPNVSGGAERLRQAARELADGKIVAIKGIGGYHLACDASNQAAVSELRRRKQRGDKPFAVMVRDLKIAAMLVDLDEESASLLAHPARPIVVLPSRDYSVGKSVSPSNSSIGVMLPYTGIHHLLFDHEAPNALVMTSGNLSDEPICVDSTEAEDRLSELADAFVHHNRPIYLPCDDSVAQMMSTGPQPIRRSRGIVPEPLVLPVEGPMSIAVGGELKTTAGISDGRHAWLSQHIGDTSSVETLQVLARTVQLLTDIQRVDATRVISDLHPGYLSARWAADYAREHRLEHLAVQHHHAHMASLLTEHSIPPNETVLAFSLDGTGFGLDGTIWGGELLLGSYASATRVGHLSPIPLPGADAATRHPARAAAAHLRAAGVPWDRTLAPIAALGPDAAVLASMLASGTACVTTTSAGRLFDAVSSLVDLRHEVDYEGQAAIELEAACSASNGLELPMPVAETPRGLVLEAGPLIEAVAEATLSGVPVADIASGFHTALARALTVAAVRIREEHGVDTVGLTGGVFANRLLSERLRGSLVLEGFGVLTHENVPPNDGGLALGQLAVANAGGGRPWRAL